jgi:hypothetical protein
LDSFPALPACLFGGEGGASQFRPQAPVSFKSPEKSQRRGRDSNPLDSSREELPNGPNQAASGDVSATPRDATKRAEPERVDTDAALKVAIKAAVDAGQWQRVEALTAIARASAG